MKKFFTFLFNFFCWFLDSILWVLETVIKAFGLFVNFLLTVGIDLQTWIIHVLQYKTWDIPVPKKRFEGSYILQGIRMFGKVCFQVIVYVCIWYTVPEIRACLASIGLFLRKPWLEIFVMLCAFIFLLPQQQLLRDPVTRFFFRRGWFKHYGQAWLFTKTLSFLIIIALFCGVWIP